MNWRLLAPLSGRTLAADPFLSLQRELNRVFDDVLTAPSAAASTALRLDVKEDEQAFHITADLPGLAEKDVEVTFHEGTLTIRGEKKIERDEKTDTWHIVERSTGSFARQLVLPAKIDAEKVAAVFDKGVLTVTLPKLPEAKVGAKKIEVKSAS